MLKIVSVKKIFFSLTVLFFFLLSSPCLAGEWNLTGSLNQGRSSFSSEIFDNGDVLVAGGIANSIGLSSCEIYDISTGIWNTTDSMTFARQSFSLVKFRHNGVKKFLAVGGTQSLIAEIFDPQPLTWEETGSMHYWRLGASGIAFPDPNNEENDLVLIVGGDWENDYKSCEIYNPDTGIFTLTGFCAYPKIRNTLELLPDGKIMAIGGGNSYYGYCEIYDISTEIWTETDDLNEQRIRHTSHLLPNGNPMAIAGDGTQYNNSCEIYDFQTEEWTFTDSLEIGRTNHCSEILLNNKILVMGGLPGTACQSCELYNPITNEWQTAASTYYPYYNFSTEKLLDERVLAIRSWCEIYEWNYQPTVSQPQNLNGLNEATIGETLSFSVIASDPDDDSVAVRIDWDDGEISEWTGLQPSGSTFELSHSWDNRGTTYKVRAQSADQWYFLNELCHNSLSEWGDTLLVTITPGPSIDPSYNTELAVRIYPNPFSTSTTISFQETVNLHENARIEIYNIKGQMVKTFTTFPSASWRIGTREVVWDGRDDKNQHVGSGIYFYKLMIGEKEIASNKMLLLR